MTTTTTESIDYSVFQFPEIAKAVVAQMGGEEIFLNCWEDIINHGISGGFGGFIYYTDTTRFSKYHLRLIREMAKSQAEDLGVGTLEMIQGFRCLGNDYSIDEIGETLFGANDNEQILNALAWYAAEETCHAFSISRE